MSAVFDELSSKAMTLSSVERARLADLMVESLDDAPLTDIDQAWIKLAQQRADEIRAGTAKTHDADDVIAEARRSIGR